jgi:hypothetical protein
MALTFAGLLTFCAMAALAVSIFVAFHHHP